MWAFLPESTGQYCSIELLDGWLQGLLGSGNSCSSDDRVNLSSMSHRCSTGLIFREFGGKSTPWSHMPQTIPEWFLQHGRAYYPAERPLYLGINHMLWTVNTPQDLPSWRCSDPVISPSQFCSHQSHLDPYPCFSCVQHIRQHIRLWEQTVHLLSKSRQIDDQVWRISCLCEEFQQLHKARWEFLIRKITNRSCHCGR